MVARSPLVKPLGMDVLLVAARGLWLFGARGLVTRGLVPRGFRLENVHTGWQEVGVTANRIALQWPCTLLVRCCNGKMGTRPGNLPRAT